MQPRWVLFLRAHNLPDNARGPGVNARFMSWIGDAWQTWRKANGRGRFDPLSASDHSAFDAWLSTYSG